MFMVEHRWFSVVPEEAWMVVIGAPWCITDMSLNVCSKRIKFNDREVVYLDFVVRTDTWRASGMANFLTSTVTCIGLNSESTIAARSIVRVSMRSQCE